MTINTAPVSPKETFAALTEMANVWRFPVMLHGAPGIGKTSMIEQLADLIAATYVDGILAKGSSAYPIEWTFAIDEATGAVDRALVFSFERKRRLRDVRLTTIESVDLRGLPVLDHSTKQSRFYSPEFLPTFAGPGIIFLDEITAAERRLQASAYSLLQERRIGSYEVPDGWFICCAGNGAEHGAISHEMGTALADRMVHFNVVATTKSWIDWAVGVSEAPEVISFIQTRPDYLEGCEKRVKNEDLIGPSPRGWSRVSTLIKTIKSRDLLKNIIPGIVGEVAASEFFFVLDELSDIVKVGELLKADKSKRGDLLPKTTTGLYGIAYALVGAMEDAETLEQVFETFAAMRELSIKDVPSYEIAVLGMEMAVERGFKMDLADAMIKSQTYRRYYQERKAQGLAS